MAKLTIKIEYTGEEFEIEDVDLKQYTPRQLIDVMISQRLLPSEAIATYAIVNKNNGIIGSDELCLTFAQLGFVEGDIIRIISKPTAGGDTSFSYSNNYKSEFSYESTPLGPLFEEKIAISKLEQLQLEEERCRGHIEMLYRLKEKAEIEACCRGLGDQFRVAGCVLKRFKSVDKMQDLLYNRLSQLQNSSSFFSKLRGDNELKLIKELLRLLELL
ncbi:MAG: hypothetical protein ACI30V_02025, partial [Muribaculaceae bacterium]